MIGLSIYIEGQRLDLFKSENISVKSSVKDLKDISKVYTDFSKSFTVPPSKDNNKIFQHYYNADNIGGFDARTSKTGILELDGQLFRKGLISLIDVKLSNGEISHYSIRFKGESIKVKEEFGDDELSDLDFSHLDYLNDDATVKQSFTSDLFDGKICHTLITDTKRVVFDSDDNYVNDEFSSNIHYNPSDFGNNVNKKLIKPSIKTNEIFKAIKNKYDISFVGNIFSRDYVSDLYMWLSTKDGLKTKSSQTDSQVIFTSSNSPFVNLATNLYNPSILIEPFYVIIEYFQISTTSTSTLYNIVMKSNGFEIFRLDGNTGNRNITGTITNSQYSTLLPNITFHIESDDNFEYQAYLITDRYNGYGAIPVNETTYTSSDLTTIDSYIDVSANMPKIKVFDFVMGFVKMFNLVLFPNEDGSITMQTVEDWYKDGSVFDISKYVDRKDLKVSRGDLYNTFKFNYQEPKTILAKQFKENNNIAYGDLESKLFDENGKLLEGGTLAIKLPFEQMVYERNSNLADGNFTFIQNGYSVDNSFKTVVPKPLLHYKSNVVSGNVGWYNFNNTYENLTNINVPSINHSLTDNSDLSLAFGEEFSTYNYGKMQNSLFNSFWSDYIGDTFSNRRRKYTLEANLPLKVITNLKLNDRLVIDSTRYLINGMSTNLTNGVVQFDLLNDIYEAGSNELDGIVLNTRNTIVGYNVNSKTISYTSSEKVEVEIFDVGSGVFTSLVGNTFVNKSGAISLNLTNNDTLLFRVQTIRLKTANSFVDFQITQESSVNLFTITADNTIVTADSDIITI